MFRVNNSELGVANQVTSSHGGAEKLTVEVLSMTEEMLPGIGDLHLSACSGLMSARLGPAYVRAFMSWFLRAPKAVTLVAADQQGAIVGYVVGAPVGYTAAMNRELVWVAARSLVARPWLLFDSQIRSTLKVRLGFIHGRSAADANGLPSPTMSLVGIAVAPSAAGKRVGFSLMQAFEKQARALTMASLRLSVYPDNVAARHLYERCGWHVLADSHNSTGTIHYGRVL